MAIPGPDLLESIGGALMAVDDWLVAQANQAAPDLLGWDESLVGQALHTSSRAACAGSTRPASSAA